MPASLAFLHTAPVHVQTFSALLERLRPGTEATHVVAEDLLRDARELGHGDSDVIRRVQDAVRSLADAGAAVVVCTCSTIGAAAEATPGNGRFRAMRIDRAMADEAVRRGPRVLVVAALESSLAPTAALIEDSARCLGQSVVVQSIVATGAWRHFEEADMAAYLAAVQAGVRSAVPGPDVVVLAQASMAGAAAGLSQLGIPILSSPEPGLRAALACLDP